MNRSEINKKAAATRLKKDPDAFRKMGAKGGKNSSSRPFRDTPGLAARAGHRRQYLKQNGSLAYEPLDSDPRK